MAENPLLQLSTEGYIYIYLLTLKTKEHYVTVKRTKW